MRIALHTPLPLQTSLGGAKNRIESAEAFTSIGVDVDVFGGSDVLPSTPAYGIARRGAYSEALASWIRRLGANYDVILFEANSLDFRREAFPARPLLVARPRLLAQHGVLFPPRTPRDWRYVAKTTLSRYLHPRGRRAHRDAAVATSIEIRAFQEADLIQVQNDWDCSLVRALGILRKPVVVVPNGLSERRIAEIESLGQPHASALGETIGFVGSFDYRKGCLDLADAFSMVTQRRPTARLRLLGAKGLFRTENEVLRHFPTRLRPQIELVLTFPNDELYTHLAGVDVGVFPSYFESFGFGALEMMGGRIPTVAYRAPGPHSFVPSELLVERGCVATLAERLCYLLDNPSVRERLGRQCQEVALRYTWKASAEKALEAYRQQIESRSGRCEVR